MEEKFTENDIKHITERGNSVEVIKNQLRFFYNGIQKINLVDFATTDNGIWAFDETEKQKLISYFEKHQSNYQIKKFVPASGAASRMFKFLSEFLNDFNPENGTINGYVNRKNAIELKLFLVGIKDLPFYQKIKDQLIKSNPNYFGLERAEKNYLFIKTMLSADFFDFANKPKGILPFHKKNEELITPIEEHIKEASFYKVPNKKTKIHFTVSKEHQKEFEDIASKYPDFEISFSYQMQSTDTIAVNLDNSIFRLPDENVFFRPGGHGALIENLNQLQSDIIFIKNIDNVAFNHFDTIINNKKVLGGVLLRMQFMTFRYLKKLENPKISASEIKEIVLFLKEKLSTEITEDFDKFQIEFQREYLINSLNKPIRVCGMVKNEGEPGGGPFWVKDQKGRISLQIVEASQVDSNNKNQLEILKNATHFNPVDLVCGIKNYKNQKFNLLEFVDENAGFIVEKTKNGKPIKAYELPGLWNGAMAKWLTLFVEVPIETFNPVKTVNDLLKPSHQPLETNG